MQHDGAVRAGRKFEQGAFLTGAAVKINTLHACCTCAIVSRRFAHVKRAATGEPPGIKTEPEMLNVWKVKSDPASSLARGG